MFDTAAFQVVTRREIMDDESQAESLLAENTDSPNLVKPILHIREKLLDLYFDAELVVMGALPNLEPVLNKAHDSLIPLFATLASTTSDAKVCHYSTIKSIQVEDPYNDHEHTINPL
jgi:hypothetical protein